MAGLAVISVSVWPAAAPAAAVQAGAPRPAFPEERRTDRGTPYERAVAAQLAQGRTHSPYGETRPVARELEPAARISSSATRPSYVAVVVAVATLVVLAGLRLRPHRPRRFTTI